MEGTGDRSLDERENIQRPIWRLELPSEIYRIR